jgi:hypothetical protein
MGLAEISKNNPLKVLHSLLEGNNLEMAFVGISNWRLDASKIENLTLLNTVQEGVDAIYLNDLENEFQDEDDTAGESEFGDSYGEDYD